MERIAQRLFSGERTTPLVMASLLTVGFLAAFFHPESYFRDPRGMVHFFRGSFPTGADFDGAWPWTRHPFNYRVVFHGAVDALATLMQRALPGHNGALYLHRALALASGLSFVAAGLALVRLLRVLRCSWGERWVGLACWLALPGVHHAYLYPTNVKEDFLAFAIFFAGLAELVAGRTRRVLWLSLLGAATRETLLLLPGLFCLVRGVPWWHRLACLVLAVVVQLVIRAVQGFGEYGVLHQGLHFNLANPGTSALALWLLAGFCWIPLLARVELSGRTRVQDWFVAGPALDERSFWRLFLPAVLVLLPAHFVLGRMGEIRISMLLAPWAIVALLRLLQRVPLRKLAHVSTLAPPLLVLALCGALELSQSATQIREALNPYIGQFSSTMWWVAMYFQLALTTVVARLFVVHGGTRSDLRVAT